MSGSPLRVAMMLESDGPGGAEVMLLQLSEELRRRGHVVYPVGPASGTSWLTRRLVDEGFERHTFHLDRVLDWGCVGRLRELFERLRVDVVHSHEFTMGVYGAAAARGAGVPHTITWHGSQTMCRALRRRIAVRWAIRRSQASVAVSEATRRQLAGDLGISPERLLCIPNGVPRRVGSPDAVRRELGWREGEVLLVAVGNLSERKGHLLLLQALSRLRQEGVTVPWRLAIAGGRGGEMHEALTAYAAEHGLRDRVHLLLNRDDIPDLLAAADVFAMPSLWEGLPLALLEAMLAGKAIVASDTSGIPEAATTERQALLTPPGDVPALAGALRRLLEEPALRRRLAAAAQTRAEAEFTIERMADRYEATYRAGLVATGRAA